MKASLKRAAGYGRTFTSLNLGYLGFSLIGWNDAFFLPSSLDAEWQNLKGRLRNAAYSR